MASRARCGRTVGADMSNASIDWIRALKSAKRSRGSRASALISRCSIPSGRSATNWRGGGSGSVACLTRMDIGVSATYGLRPATISYNTIPIEYKSDCGPDLPSHCSGAIYSGVPTNIPVPVRCVDWSVSKSLAIPKSESMGSPFSVIRILAGLISRCTMPCW